jgi:hypothetical protein
MAPLHYSHQFGAKGIVGHISGSGKVVFIGARQAHKARGPTLRNFHKVARFIRRLWRTVAKLARFKQLAATNLSPTRSPRRFSLA